MSFRAAVSRPARGASEPRQKAASRVTVTAECHGSRVDRADGGWSSVMVCTILQGHGLSCATPKKNEKNFFMQTPSVHLIKGMRREWKGDALNEFEGHKPEHNLNTG